jgi:hypothetical protein
MSGKRLTKDTSDGANPTGLVGSGVGSDHVGREFEPSPDGWTETRAVNRDGTAVDDRMVLIAALAAFGVRECCFGREHCVEEQPVGSQVEVSLLSVMVSSFDIRWS